MPCVTSGVDATVSRAVECFVWCPPGSISERREKTVVSPVLIANSSFLQEEAVKEGERRCVSGDSNLQYIYSYCFGIIFLDSAQSLLPFR